MFAKTILEHYLQTVFMKTVRISRSGLKHTSLRQTHALLSAGLETVRNIADSGYVENIHTTVMQKKNQQPWVIQLMVVPVLADADLNSCFFILGEDEEERDRLWI